MLVWEIPLLILAPAALGTLGVLWRMCPVLAWAAALPAGDMQVSKTAGCPLWSQSLLMFSLPSITSLNPSAMPSLFYTLSMCARSNGCLQEPCYFWYWPNKGLLLWAAELPVTMRERVVSQKSWVTVSSFDGVNCWRGNSCSRTCEPTLYVLCRGWSCRVFVLRCSFPHGLNRQAASCGWCGTCWWIHKISFSHRCYPQCNSIISAAHWP